MAKRDREETKAQRDDRPRKHFSYPSAAAFPTAPNTASSLLLPPLRPRASPPAPPHLPHHTMNTTESGETTPTSMAAQARSLACTQAQRARGRV
eukprot:3087209-Pleurochrysis_carterae.AAC.2